jgi:lipoprotein-anchoring transpeptidase ErfK/SrfK
VNISRRTFLAAGGIVAATALAGCTSSRNQTVVYQDRQRRDQALWASNSQAALYYAEKLDEPFPLPAIPYQKIDPKFHRQVVADPTGQPPGTLVVDTGNHFLYLTQPGGQAIRYGVGLGREGFAWAGRGVIQYKRRWPKWTPPAEMVARQPELQQKLGPEGFMEPGLNNPLGARAHYIFHNGEDTLYRIHGSPEWWSIGKSVSSGCVRMINQDVCDLFDRVPNKTAIVVTDLSRGGYEMSENLDDAAPREVASNRFGEPEYGEEPYRVYEPQPDNDIILDGPVY